MPGMRRIGRCSETGQSQKDFNPPFTDPADQETDPAERPCTNHDGETPWQPILPPL